MSSFLRILNIYIWVCKLPIPTHFDTFGKTVLRIRFVLQMCCFNFRTFNEILMVLLSLRDEE